jgi:VanZ family protein
MDKKNLLRWLPGLGMMVIIFGASSTPGSDLPTFGIWDAVVKKGFHMLGYGLLALAYWYGFDFAPGRWRYAFLLALLFAVTDEFHQSFTPGRHPSWVDVFGFDGGGAAIALGLTYLRLGKKRSRQD